MKDSLAMVSTLTVVALLMSLPIVWKACQDSTSNYWQTEAVKRGFATWETTTNGQVWFKWKEETK